VAARRLRPRKPPKRPAKGYTTASKHHGRRSQEKAGILVDEQFARILRGCGGERYAPVPGEKSGRRIDFETELANTSRPFAHFLKVWWLHPEGTRVEPARHEAKNC